jgi:hypothetical protein
MQNRRLFQACSVAALGVGLACAPMTLASANSQPKNHHKAPKHHTSKKPTFTSGSAECKNFLNTVKGSSGLGTAFEKAMAGAGSGFAGVQQAFLSYFNTVEKYEAPFEAELRSAPANVQAAGKGIFVYFNTLKTDVANATSLQQLGTSMESLGTNSALRSDAQTLANYFGSICGSVTTTTPSLP